MSDIKNQGNDHLFYAGILEVLVKISMTVLTGSYLVYFFGGSALRHSPENIASLWSFSLPEFSNMLNASAETPKYLGLDFIPDLGVKLIASVSLVCITLLSIHYLKNRKCLYAVITLIQVGIIAFAMSGIANYLF